MAFEAFCFCTGESNFSTVNTIACTNIILKIRIAFSKIARNFGTFQDCLQTLCSSITFLDCAQLSTFSNDTLIIMIGEKKKKKKKKIIMNKNNTNVNKITLPHTKKKH